MSGYGIYRSMWEGEVSAYTEHYRRRRARPVKTPHPVSRPRERYQRPFERGWCGRETAKGRYRRLMSLYARLAADPLTAARVVMVNGRKGPYWTTEAGVR